MSVEPPAQVGPTSEASQGQTTFCGVLKGTWKRRSLYKPSHDKPRSGASCQGHVAIYLSSWTSLPKCGPPWPIMR